MARKVLTDNKQARLVAHRILECFADRVAVINVAIVGTSFNAVRTVTESGVRGFRSPPPRLLIISLLTFSKTPFDSFLFVCAATAPDRPPTPYRSRSAIRPSDSADRACAASANSFSMPGRPRQNASCRCRRERSCNQKYRLATEGGGPRPTRRMINIQRVVAVDAARAKPKGSA